MKPGLQAPAGAELQEAPLGLQAVAFRGFRHGLVISGLGISECTAFGTLSTRLQGFYVEWMQGFGLSHQGSGIEG